MQACIEAEKEQTIRHRGAVVKKKSSVELSKHTIVKSYIIIKIKKRGGMDVCSLRLFSYHNKRFVYLPTAPRAPNTRPPKSCCMKKTTQKKVTKTSIYIKITSKKKNKKKKQTTKTHTPHLHHRENQAPYTCGYTD